VRAAAAGLLGALALAGCGAQESAPAPSTEPDVVARVYGRPITQAELDSSHRLWLHDLELARYERRRARLEEILVAKVLGPRAAAAGLSLDAYIEAHARGDRDTFVAAVLAEARVEVLLEEPAPPVVEVDETRGAVRGDPEAPVAIVSFIDFQSPHARQLEPTLQHLAADYAGQVRVLVRNFPQPYHRSAVLAAEAALCAGEQGAYWPYHAALFGSRDALDRAGLERRATNLALDTARFARCLDDHRFAGDVQADIDAARRLGVPVVPTSFVNGRYLRGARSYDAFAKLIDAELEQLGIEKRPHERAAASSASHASAAPVPAPNEPPPETGTLLALPADGVEAAFAQLPALEAQLEKVPGEPGELRRAKQRIERRHPRALEGVDLDARHSAVRVRRVRSGDLLDRMGLRPGDVLAYVNDRFVVDDGALLWTALRGEEAFALVILRRGLPLTYYYVVTTAEDAARAAE
jgi:protein-disulfide isomerase